MFLRSLCYRSSSPMSHFDHDYKSVIESFQLINLYDVGQIQDIMFLFRIFNDMIDSPDLLSRFMFRVPSRPTRNNAELFHIPVSHRNYFLRSLVVRVFELYI